MNTIYYVSMTDHAMRGWGRAEGKLNKLVFTCDSHEEATIVITNAKERPEMKRINISTNKPHYNNTRYLVQYKAKANGGCWYVKDHFKSRD